MRFIPTKVHAVLDYLTAITLFSLPRVLNWDRDVTTLLTILSFGTVVYSLLTRFEGGLLRVLPMRLHLLLDLISGVGLASSPYWLVPNVDEETKLVLTGLGIFEIAASLLTKSHSSAETTSDSRATTGRPASAH